jgi:hypothetical protein
MKKCHYCGFESGGKYCPDCGKKMDAERLDAKTVFHEIFVKGILHWENSKLKTFKHMILYPGNSVRTYIECKREMYVKPFMYFFSIQTMFVVIYHLLSGRYFSSLEYTSINHEQAERLHGLINSYINYLYYFLPVFFSLYVYLFLKKKSGLNYAESTVATLYWLGTSLVFSIASMLLSLIHIQFWNAGIFFISIYLIYALMQFTNEKNVNGFFRSLTIVFMSYLTYFLFVLLILQIFLMAYPGLKL